jgi:hypothetical protein
METSTGGGLKARAPAPLCSFQQAAEPPGQMPRQAAQRRRKAMLGAVPALGAKMEAPMTCRAIALGLRLMPLVSFPLGEE